jgi:hypothetical protein
MMAETNLIVVKSLLAYFGMNQIFCLAHSNILLRIQQGLGLFFS